VSAADPTAAELTGRAGLERGCIRPGLWLVEGHTIRRNGRRWQLLPLEGDTPLTDTTSFGAALDALIAHRAAGCCPDTSTVERVARGASLLDDHHPGWWRRINLAALDLGNPRGCVLGQLFEDDSYLPYRHGLADLGLDWNACEDIDFGFSAAGEIGFAELTALWVAEIRRRTGGAA
jgi:hypothetical protein